MLRVRFRLRADGTSAAIRYPELARVLGVAPGATVDASAARAAVLGLRRGKGMVLDAADHDTWSVGSFFTNPVLPAGDVPDVPGLPRWPAGPDRVKLPAPPAAPAQTTTSTPHPQAPPSASRPIGV